MEKELKFEDARRLMVKRQIARRGIQSKDVLDAMGSVPRHEFVLPDHIGESYSDYPLPIGYGQTISQPYIVALMTEQLDVQPEDFVLEIGTGSGYQAAVLARLAAHVTSIERIPELAERAKETLERLKIDNVDVVVGDGSLGWSAGSPFDRIIVTAGAPQVPEAIIEQLAEGGRIVIPVGSEYVQDLVIVRKEKGKILTELSVGCRFVKLIGDQGWPTD